MKVVTIESASIETLTVTLRSTSDPTGGDVEYVVTASSATSPSGTWQAGSWGSYANKIVTSTTPTLGASGATLELTEGNEYTLWVRVGGSTVLRAARLIVQ